MNAEHQQLEWKESWRDEHLKWVCAFANSEGSTLVIGRNDEGHAVGLPQARKLLEDLPNKVRDLLGVVVQVNLRTEGGHAVLELLTPAYPTPISYLRAVAAPRMAQAAAPVIPQLSDPVSDLVSDPVVQLLRALLGGPLPTSALMADLRLKHRHSFRTRYLRPAMEGGWIEPTLPDKLNSRLQRYRLTAAGRARAQALLLTEG
jgi:hypothetical protein